MLSLAALGSIFSSPVIVLAAVVSLAWLMGWVRRKRRERDRQAELLRLEAELRTFVDASLTVGARLARVERVARGGWDAEAIEPALVRGSAQAREPALVRGSAQVREPALVRGSAQLREPALLRDPAQSREPAQNNGRALDLAARGAGIDDLVAACDLSRSEAGLLIALQRRGHRALSAA